MKTRLYIDKGEPLFALDSERLTDGSYAWNLHIRGGEVIPCVNERVADGAFELLAQAVLVATGERPLVL